MIGLFFVQKWRFFFKHLPILQKKKYFYNPVRVSLAILMQIRKKICFCSSFKFAVVLVRAEKKTRCRRMAPVPPFWDTCQWQIFPWKLKYTAKYILKAFFLTTFPSTQKKCPKIYAVTLVLPLNYSAESYCPTEL